MKSLLLLGFSCLMLQHTANAAITQVSYPEPEAQPKPNSAATVKSSQPKDAKTFPDPDWKAKKPKNKKQFPGEDWKPKQGQ